MLGPHQLSLARRRATELLVGRRRCTDARQSVNASGVLVDGSLKKAAPAVSAAARTPKQTERFAALLHQRWLPYRAETVSGSPRGFLYPSADSFRSGVCIARKRSTDPM
jgi:hypothetical protein